MRFWTYPENFSQIDALVRFSSYLKDFTFVHWAGLRHDNARTAPAAVLCVDRTLVADPARTSNSGRNSSEKFSTKNRFEPATSTYCTRRSYQLSYCATFFSNPNWVVEQTNTIALSLWNPVCVLTRRMKLMFHCRSWYIVWCVTVYAKPCNVPSLGRCSDFSTPSTSGLAASALGPSALGR